MIIEYGNKLGKDTKPDQKKLELLEGENKHTTIITNNKNKQEKNIETVDKNEKNLKSNSLYSISSIETENNTIVIKFNKEISKQDIAASSLKNKNGFDNIVDINGTYNPNKVEDLSIKTSHIVLKKTISIGISFFPDDTEAVWQCIKFADIALYKAKQQGRNRVIRFNEEMWSKAGDY